MEKIVTFLEAIFKKWADLANQPGELNCTVWQALPKKDEHKNFHLCQGMRGRGSNHVSR